MGTARHAGGVGTFRRPLTVQTILETITNEITSNIVHSSRKSCLPTERQFGTTSMGDVWVERRSELDGHRSS